MLSCLRNVFEDRRAVVRVRVLLSFGRPLPPKVIRYDFSRKCNVTKTCGGIDDVWISASNVRTRSKEDHLAAFEGSIN